MAARSSRTSTPKDVLSFEEALKRLDETVQKLEAGKLSLSEATALYEEGMRLARICSERIATAELKITQIRTAYGEQMRLTGDEPDADEDEEDDEEATEGGGKP
jgi:exodeoxyribonuclease VII small subunit